jgi:hypothetical protein
LKLDRLAFTAALHGSGVEEIARHVNPVDGVRTDDELAVSATLVEPMNAETRVPVATLAPLCNFRVP